jgi:hypothetical protein
VIFAPAHGWNSYNPQVLPVLQDDALLLGLKENEPPPETLDAKVDTFFFTAFDWHFGQVTSLTALLLRTNSSNDFPQSPHTNSKIGIRLCS